MIEVLLRVLFLGSIGSAHGGGAVWAETRALVPGLAIGLLWAVVLAATGLALASLSGRRAYATGAVAIFFFLSWTLSEILIAVGRGRGPFTGGSGGAPATGPPLGGLARPLPILDGRRR